MAINKVVYGADTLLDLTEDTVTEDKVLKGETFHDRSGVSRTGNVNVPVPEDITVVDEFISYNGGRVKSAQMELKPIQDLHGYDSPWVGESRKNKCPLTVDGIKSANTTVTWNGNSCVFNGVIITILTDTNNNVIGLKFLGTASSYFYFNVNSNFTIDGTYIISPLPQGAAYSSAFYGRLYYTDQTDTGFLSSEVTVTKQNAVGRMQIVVSTNATVDFTYQPMLRLSTESDPTFEPYENKCPISGHTQAKLEQRGKNRAIPPENGVFNGTNGAFTSSNTYAYVVADVEPNKLYTVSAEHRGNIGYVLFFKGTLATPVTNFISAISIGDVASYTFRAPEGCTIVVYETGGSSIPIQKDTIGNVQIELGSTATAYEPYQGKDYIINLGGTYYWLRGDAVSGKWYVVGKVVDLGTSTWTYRSDIGLFQAQNFGIDYSKDPTKENISSAYPFTWVYESGSAATASMPNFSFALYGGNSQILWVKDSRYTDPDLFKTAMTGQMACLYLATPIPLDLTPQQILAIIGENHFSAPLEQQEIIEIIARNIAEFNEVIDDENVSEDFTYSSEKIEDRLEDFVDKDAVEEKSATTEFETINGGLLSECKVSLSPNQDLHGYSEPWVGGASKQLYNHEQTSNNNILVTLNNEGSLDAVGTPSSSVSSIRLCNPTLMLKAGTYKATLISGNNLPSGVQLSVSSVIGGSWTRLGIGGIGETFTFTLNDDNTPIGVTLATTVTAGTAVNITNIKLLITADNVTDRTWCPYSNICPISGHTQVEVDVSDGQNLFDSSDIITNTRLTNLTGNAYKSANDVVSDVGFFTSALIAVKQGYIVTKNSPNEDVYHRWHIYDANGICVRFTSDNVITIGSGESYVALCGVNSEIDTTQIRQDYRVTVNLGGTYYSGVLDVVTGVFTPDTAKTTINDCISNRTTSYDHPVFYGTISGLKNGNPIMYSDKLRIIEGKTSASDFASNSENGDFTNNSYNTGASIQVFLRMDDYSDVPSLKSAIGDAEIVYEIATPTPIQLSPTMVKALVGENHLSAPLDGQEITESKYRELFTWDEVEEIAQKIADSKIDNLNTSYNTTFSSAFTEARYVKKIYGAPVLTAGLQIVLSGATSITFNHQLIFSDSQTCCELIQFGSGPRIGITDVAISQGSVTFTFDSPLTKAIGFRCRITNDFVS